MRLTLESDYAIRIVEYLTSKNKVVGAAEISEQASIPRRFAKNILQKLTKEEIIRSYKGIYGGYELARNPEEISLYDIVKVTEGSLALNHCRQGEKKCICVSDIGCPFSEIFTEMSLELETRLREIKFGPAVYKRQMAEGK